MVVSKEVKAVAEEFLRRNPDFPCCDENFDLLDRAMMLSGFRKITLDNVEIVHMDLVKRRKYVKPPVDVKEVPDAATDDGD